MTGSQKFTWGLILNVFGVMALAVGMALTFTFIGAILGIPMMLFGLPLMIWGAVWTWQGNSERQQEALARGIRQGLQESQSATLGAGAVGELTAQASEAASVGEAGNSEADGRPV